VSNQGSGPAEHVNAAAGSDKERSITGETKGPGALVFGPLSLAEGLLLTRSKTRYIYKHPNDPSLLVKVHIPRVQAGSQKGLKARLESLKDRFLYTSGIERDLRHFIASRYQDYGPVCQRIWPVHGVAQTDMGLGLLVAAARDEQGHLAPTLRTLLDEKRLTPSRVNDLKMLVDWVVESPLTFADLNLENIVLEGAGGGLERFVIIDGLGDRTWIPTQRWFRWVRQAKKKEFRAKVHRYLEESGL
jgi:hypothetical protein